MADLSYVIDELNSIINELNSVRYELGSFQGINTEKCSSAIGEMVDKYQTSRSRLYNIDTSKVDE